VVAVGVGYKHCELGEINYLFRYSLVPYANVDKQLIAYNVGEYARVAF
jgi:hypothetical protein